jgi:hypothetical protein
MDSSFELKLSTICSYVTYTVRVQIASLSFSGGIGGLRRGGWL